MLDVGFFERKKIAALPWRRQLGFIYVLTRAKLQDREGVFASKAVLKVTAGVFRDGVEDWMQTGLLHEASALCDKCVVAFPGLDDGNVAVHDWHEYQVSRTTAWRIDKGMDETTVEQPRNIGETPMKHPSRARVTRFTVPSSETEKTEGGPGETTGYPVEGSDRDALDTYHELTRWRPWGAWSGKALRRAMDDYGNEAVDAALRAEHDHDPDRDTLMDRAFARLARETEKAKHAKPKVRLVKPPRDEAAIAAAKAELYGTTA